MDEAYGRFGSYSRVEMERFFHLDDEDRRLVAARRRDYNRLGFAVQMVTVRYLGMFLPDPLEVPPELVEYLAEQLGIGDPSCVKSYTDRRMTRFEHASEIQQEYGLSTFADVEADLAVWIADQAWMTGDGPKAIFAGAVAWLRARQTLLPGITTLERLVSEGRKVADQRLWTQLAGQVPASRGGALLALLDVPVDSKRRVSELERLRRGVFRPSSKGGRLDTGKIATHWEDMCRVAVSIHSGEVSAHDVTRMISRDGNPTPLGQAIAHYGRIFKTLHILRLVDDEPYRREGKTQANLVEGRHDLARRIYHGKKGEMVRTYYEGMEDQLSALRAGAQLRRAVEHRLQQPRPRSATRPRLSGPRRRRGTVVGVHPRPHRHRRALCLQPARPRRRSPAAA